MKTLPHMSPREAQALAMIAKGMSNPDIAKELGLSVETVKIHVHKAFRRLGVNNRTEAAVLYTQAKSKPQSKAAPAKKRRAR